jgi:MoxR-like ATPase
LADLQQEIQSVTVEEGILEYITRIGRATRQSPDLLVGGSPRAGITLLLTSKTYAAIQGRDFVTPDDVKALVMPTFRHRIILQPEAEIDGLTPDTLLRRLLSGVPVPR